MSTFGIGVGWGRAAGNDMRQHLSPESVCILHELDLGRHTLLLMSDGSMELLATEEQRPDLAQTGLQLDTDETYRLFISLHEQFKQQQGCRQAYRMQVSLHRRLGCRLTSDAGTTNKELSSSTFVKRVRGHADLRVQGAWEQAAVCRSR